MKISKLFHWLYAILMLLPFGLVLFNMLHGLFSPSATGVFNFGDWFVLIEDPVYQLTLTEYLGGLCDTIRDVYSYLVFNVFGFSTDSDILSTICSLLTYWTSISIIWLVFDLFMYVPLLVHRWIDKAKLE